ncbi:MAG TPA: monothiol bacilliredoxin BrxC family protein [Bryobacteraceae bacterium]|nr:monothiol bacilliredoxin BrxC family protein [Bryobacteraceae bacterium]
MFNWWRKVTEPETQIPNIIDLEVPLRMELAILFKHSPKCPVSLVAYREVVHFRKQFPAIPVFLISVREERALAVAISERTGIAHASPQILVLQKGFVQSVLSHDQITADDIGDVVASQPQTEANA